MLKYEIRYTILRRSWLSIFGISWVEESKTIPFDADDEQEAIEQARELKKGIYFFGPMIKSFSLMSVEEIDIS